MLRALADAAVEYPVELTVSEVRPEKSDAQRAYFHATCGELGAALGYTLGEFKDLVKCAYYGEGWRAQSTETLDVVEYGRLIEVAHMLGAWGGAITIDLRQDADWRPYPAIARRTGQSPVSLQHACLLKIRPAPRRIRITH